MTIVLFVQLFMIGTHDIQNISVSSPQPGEIRVTGDFIDGSTATGVLLILYSITKNSDIQYVIENYEQSRSIDINVTSLTSTQYGVSTFVLDNGQIFPRVVALPEYVTVQSIEQTGRLF